MIIEQPTKWLRWLYPSAIWRMNPTEKAVYLTFDDGPIPESTPWLIETLDRYGVKATFFMVGQNAEAYPDVVKKAVASGHEIGNHSYDHPLLTDYDYDYIADQIDTTNRILKQADGKDIHLLRPPYGEFNDDVAACAGSPMIYWSVDTEDWKTLDADAVYTAIMDGVYNGAIILLHDIYETTCDGAIMAIDELKAEGWEFCTVSELFEREGIEINDGVMYYNASPEKTAHIYGEIDDADVYPEQSPEAEEEEEIIISDVTLSDDVLLYSDTESLSAQCVVSSGSVIHIYDTYSGDYTKVSTDWGTTGYVPDTVLNSMSSDEEDPGVDASSADFSLGTVKVTSGVCRLCSDVTLRDVINIIPGNCEVTVIPYNDDVSAVRLSDGTAGFVSSDQLQDYFVSPVKSVILNYSDTGFLVTDVNLRTAPSSDASIMGVITYGAVVDIVGREGMWLLISYAGYTGYVRDYTVSRSDSSCYVKAGITEKTTLYSSEGAGKIGTVKTGTVYILSEPHEYALILTSSGSVGYVESSCLEY